MLIQARSSTTPVLASLYLTLDSVNIHNTLSFLLLLFQRVTMSFHCVYIISYLSTIFGIVAFRLTKYVESPLLKSQLHK